MADQDGTLDGGPADTDGQPTGNPYSDSLIWGGKWDFTNEPTIDYYFEGASKDTQAFSASEKAAFLQILGNFEAVCNVTFTEVFTEAASDITWVKIPNDPDFVAYHDVPDGKFLPDPAYGVFTTSDGGWNNVDEQGSYFYNIVQHEIGHGMGLAHPSDGGDQSDATTFPGVTMGAGSDKGDNGLNQGIWTVMSYNSGWDKAPGVNAFGSGPSYGWAGTLMAFDIYALQYLYGVNNTYKTGDDGYVLPSANTKGTFWSCLWDAGGNDTISNAGKSGAATINLNDAPLVGPSAGGYVSYIAGIKGGFTIANSAEIENAMGGDGNDYIIGNELDNILEGGLGIDTVSYELAANDVTVSLLIQDGVTKQDTGAGQDTLSGFENLVGSQFNDELLGDGFANKIQGGAGDDRINGGGGNDILIGGTGVNTLSYANATGALTVSLATTAQQDTKGSGKDTVSGFQNLVGGGFGDKLTGDSKANIIEGGNGDDVIDGAAGVDSLFGDAGNDTLIGGLGNDTLTGGTNGAFGDSASFAGITSAVSVVLVAGAATATYKNGSATEQDTLSEIENLIGGSGADTLTGDGLDNVIEGGAGNDLLSGGAHGGNGDTVSFASSTAAITFSLANQGVAQKTGAGTDTISDFESILGGKGADKLYGDAFKNKIDGGAGNDIIDGGASTDFLVGGDGIDTIDYSSFSSEIVVELANEFGFDQTDYDALIGFENIIGASFNDQLTGNSNANNIQGRDGKDNLSGLAGNDTIDGGAGDDLINGGDNDDVLIGGADIDTLVYSSATSGVTVSLASTAVQNTGGSGKDKISGFENLYGTDFDDVLTGSVGDNELGGSAGNDVLEGGVGADKLDGGADLDAASYKSSKIAVTVDLLADTATGGDATGDTLDNIENLIGSAKNDTLTGDDKNNVIEGGLGDDTLDGGLDDLGNGRDTISFASATAGITFSLTAQGSAQKTGGAGTDTAINFESILGGKGNDILTGDANGNIIDGGAGNDIIRGGFDPDTLIGGSGIDTLSYATSLSVVGVIVDLNKQGTVDANGNINFDAIGQQSGDAVSDQAYGFENLIGSQHFDQLLGDDSANTISGGGGGDYITGRGGNDILDGTGVFSTVFYDYLTSSQHITVTLGAVDKNLNAGQTVTSGVAGDKDTIKSFNSVYGGAGNDVLTGNGTTNELFGLGGNDRLFGMDSGDVLEGGLGNDYLDGGVSHDILKGGSGNDILIGGAGSTVQGDTLDGGDDFDTASYVGSKLAVTVNLLADTASGGDADNDTLDNIEALIGSAKNDILTGDGNDNTIEGGLGDDLLDGGAGSFDTLSYAGATAAVTVDLNLQGILQVTGGGGKDTASNFENLTGGKGNDKLTGDAFANRIEGGAGNDILVGGGGKDVFVGGAGADKMTGDSNNDLFFVSGSDGVGDTYTGGLGSDTLDFDDNAAIVFGSFNASTASIETLTGNGSAITGTTGSDVIDLSFLTSISDVDNINGAGGNDTITGSYAADLLLGGVGNDTLNGGGDNDELFGEAGNDTLNGGVGTDHLYGGLGGDTLTGGGDIDTFHIKWAEGADKITDFISGTDEIELDLAPGMANPLSLIVSNVPANAGPNAALLFDTDDGKLYYDSGPGAAVHIATLTGSPLLVLGDFTFI